MDPRIVAVSPMMVSFPRRRGDGPLTNPAKTSRPMFPPQARGWTGSRSRPSRSRPVSPAGAGMDPSTGPAARTTGSFPRRRGDGPGEQPPTTSWGWFPPQARGWTPIRSDCIGQDRVSPAGAGMDPGTSHPRRCGISFPRRRGDGPAYFFSPTAITSFPPQARGWTPIS